MVKPRNPPPRHRALSRDHLGVSSRAGDAQKSRKGDGRNSSPGSTAVSRTADTNTTALLGKPKATTDRPATSGAEPLKIDFPRWMMARGLGLL